jgi:hypothetical protein
MKYAHDAPAKQLGTRRMLPDELEPHRTKMNNQYPQYDYQLVN